jgi:YidC/Oxa1 family membrane protein insertase
MDKKLLIFLLIFFAFFFAYQKFIVDPYFKKSAPAPAVTEPRKDQPTQKQAPSPTPAPPTTAPPSIQKPTAGMTVQKITIDTPLYHAEFSSKGAILTSFRLNKYLDDFGKPLEMVPQNRAPNRPLSFDFEDPELSKKAVESNFSVDQQSLTLGGTSTGEMNFSYSDGKYYFRKYFKFKADSYLIDSVVEAKDGPNILPVRLSWGPGIEDFRSYKKLNVLKPSRAVVNIGSKVERKDPPKEKQFTKIGASARWAGVENNYFVSVYIPVKPADVFLTCVKENWKSAHNVVVTVLGPRDDALRMRVFIGPKDFYLLQQIGMDLDKAVDFGPFGPISKLLFHALRFFHKYMHNWGWAIVLLTIVVKIVFTPFMQKSFSSQKKLQAMQPEMKKIQERYAKMKNDDPRKQNMNAEIMQLHKRMGVNPLGGCLPMLVQMPVLFAFYSLLSNAIELRKAPFAFWIHDLSRPDPFYITPILMGATMLLQQRMTPASDPMQQRMLYIMPIMFSYISFNLPSGLVLYWLLSNVLGIAHQYYFLRTQKKATTGE